MTFVQKRVIIILPFKFQYWSIVWNIIIQILLDLLNFYFEMFQVTEADARDVVDLLHESLLDAYTSGTGRLDFGGKRGSNGPMSRPKQVMYSNVQHCGACYTIAHIYYFF